MDQITIRELQVFAKHGVLPEENALGQKFLVTATLFLEMEKAAEQDDLAQTLNYAAVSQEIVSFLQSNVYQLIETAADRLAKHLLLQYPLLQKITIELQKPWAPIGLPLDTLAVTVTRGWHTAFVALGSNLGDKKAYLDGAVAFLKADPYIQVQSCSDYMETEPYGGVEQDNFLNACLSMQTLYSPNALLEKLQAGEQQANRVRTIHWGPRTLDLDLLFYDDLIQWDRNLVLPHPEISRRKFVLEPLAQIAPHYVHPRLQKTVLELLAELS